MSLRLPPASRRGFTLIELLVVVGIMTLVGSLATPALLKSFRSSNLVQAGNRVADLATLARNNALSRNAMTAVVMVTGLSSGLSEVANKALTVIELGPDQTAWRQVTGWVFLPSQAKAYANQAALSPASLPVPDGGTLPVLRVAAGGRAPVTLTASDYVCYVFNPDGTLYNAALPLPQAFVQYATDQAPSGGVQSTSLPNYYNVVFSDAGGIHIVRP